MPQSQHLPIAREIMTTGLVTVRPDLPIFDAMRILLKNQISGAPVVDANGALIGMLSEFDCLKILANGEFYDDDRREEGTVADYMTAVARSVPPDLDVYSLVNFFLDHAVRRIPVVKDHKLLGQISRRDVLRTIEEMGKKRMRRKHYPDYREPGEFSQSTAHLRSRSPKPVRAARS
jgi:CBS domain-containing protein